MAHNVKREKCKYTGVYGSPPCSCASKSPEREMSDKPVEAMSREAIMEKVQGWYDCANNEGAADDADQAVVFEIAAQLRERDAAKKWGEEPNRYSSGFGSGASLLYAIAAAREDGGISE